MSLAPSLASTAPAGGAATGQVIAMVVGLSIGFGALVAIGEAQWRGRRTPLGTPDTLRRSTRTTEREEVAA